MASSRGRPALKDLLDHLGEVSEWETLGINLGIKKYKLLEIKMERRDKMILCKMDMFDYWLRSDVNASWGKIVEALEKLDSEYNSLAHSLRVKYGLGPAAQPMSVDQPMQAQPQGHSAGVNYGVSQASGGAGVGGAVPVSVSVQESGAVQSSNLANAVTALASKNISVNAVESDGYKQSALQKAVLKRDLNMVKVMVALGANVNYADDKKNTALDTALQVGDPNIKELLKRVGGLQYTSVLQDKSEPSKMDVGEEGTDGDDEMRLQKSSNVLCLDSSTDKVVVQLEALNRIELMTGKKITDMFEYLVGGGIGGLLLLAMVYAKKSVSQLQKLYYELWQRLHSEHSSKKKWRELEDFIHNLFGSHRMDNVSPDGPRVLIAAVNRKTTQFKQHFFTNFFEEGRDSRLHVYKVALYTCATPEYYDVIHDDTDHYIHGGAICRNLTAAALTFIMENYSRPPFSGVVSVGEGIWSAKDFTDETDLTARAMDALVEQTHENCKSRFLFTSTFYYRINPLFPERTPVRLDLEDLIDLQINTIAALIGPDESAASELNSLASILKA